ncbi:MAG TPA: universal stress protein [Flavipsychrobacter sp.]|jgi:hypothetical protein|nr:universal stress protein [Flavipsychrobacter sp.]
MDTIVVATDFSPSSGNAVQYACALAAEKGYKVIITHVYTMPGTYTGEGLSMVAINDGLNAEKESLKESFDSAKRDHPDISIEANMMIGDFLDSLRKMERDINPKMFIMGGKSDYSDLWLWDTDWLTAVVNIASPVLVIPSHASYAPLQNIAFACDYKNPCSAPQLKIIKELAGNPGTTLHIVHVTTDASEAENERKRTLLKDSMADFAPQYHFIEDRQIIRAVSVFVRQYHIDLLLVTPHKHGLWYNLLNKSYTKQLARLNPVPVMTISE